MAIRTRRPKRVVVAGQFPETWTWQLNYHKFRGRGANATERIVGADGIIHFSINAIERNYSKSALFQSKTTRGGHQKLLAQCILLSTWREAAFVIKYGPETYTAVNLDDALKQALKLPHSQEMQLDTFLMEVFVACLLGDTELSYEPSDRVLRWRDQAGNIVHSSFAVRAELGRTGSLRHQGKCSCRGYFDNYKTNAAGVACGTLQPGRASGYPACSGVGVDCGSASSAQAGRRFRGGWLPFQGIR